MADGKSNNITLIKSYFKGVTLTELKALSAEDRVELGDLIRAEKPQPKRKGNPGKSKA